MDGNSKDSNQSDYLTRNLTPLPWGTLPAVPKKRGRCPQCLRWNYMINNTQTVIFLIMLVGAHLALISHRVYQYWEFSTLVIIARASGQCLNFDCSLLLLLMLRRSITWLRERGFNGLLPLDKHIYFHKLVGWTVFVLTFIHLISHIINFAFISMETPHTIYQYLFTNNFEIGWIAGTANLTGIVLTIMLIIMCCASHRCVRTSGYFEVFYWTHLLCIPFWILLIIHAENFWRWFLFPGVIFLVEIAYRVFRTLCGTGKSQVEDLSLLPYKVVHLVVKRPSGFNFLPGDYIYLNVPSIARFEWHPFTISSAPENTDTLSFHIRAVGGWTNHLYNKLLNEGLEIRELQGRSENTYTNMAVINDDGLPHFHPTQSDSFAQAYPSEDPYVLGSTNNSSCSTRSSDYSTTDSNEYGITDINNQNLYATLHSVTQTNKHIYPMFWPIPNQMPISVFQHPYLVPNPNYGLTDIYGAVVPSASNPDNWYGYSQRRNQISEEGNTQAINPDGESIYEEVRQKSKANEEPLYENIRQYQVLAGLTPVPNTTLTNYFFPPQPIYTALALPLTWASVSADKPQQEPQMSEVTTQPRRSSVTPSESESLVGKSTDTTRPSPRPLLVSSNNASQSQTKLKCKSDIDQMSQADKRPPRNEFSVTLPYKMEVYIDGPYGAPSTQIFKSQHAVIVAAGIGVTPFASILQSIVNRYRGEMRPCPHCQMPACMTMPDSILKLRKVDFIWVNRELESFSWFLQLLSDLDSEQSLLGSAMESFLDIYLYRTGQTIPETKHHSPMFKGLQEKIREGRPKWEELFNNINQAKKGKITMFYCGPPALGKILNKHCIKMGFTFRKEMFSS